MQRSQHVLKVWKSDVAILLLFGVALLSVPSARAAIVGSAGISGVVRDAQGVGQLGALVQVLSSDPFTVTTAFTDVHGRYAVANLAPGRYVVRASATLFIPVSRGNLNLRTGATAVVNLTLASLFDTASWLPAERRRADEPDDDWKWTLRSTANRPILRLVEEGSSIEVSSSTNEHPTAIRTKARATVASGDGGFGNGGLHDILELHQMLGDGADSMLRTDIGSTRMPGGAGPSEEFEAGYERKIGLDGAARTVISYKAHPELATSNVSGLQEFSIASAERISLGDRIGVEAGSSFKSVHAGGYALANRPFVRISARAGGSWTVRYRFATDRELQAYGDVSTEQSELPAAVLEQGTLALESGRHQELSVAQEGKRGTIAVAVYHDRLHNTALSGGGASSLAGSRYSADGTPLSGSPLTDMLLVDNLTGNFRTLGTGYRTSGLRLTASVPLTSALMVVAEYSTGAALASGTDGTATLAEALAGLKTRGTQTAAIALKGKLVGSGTRVRASYRWQPAYVVTAVDPYSGFGDQAFFSCTLRQPIHLGTGLPQGLNATVDLTNLLAEGYRPFVSADGQTLFLAQAPRTIQAGLSLSF